MRERVFAQYKNNQAQNRIAETTLLDLCRQSNKKEAQVVIIARFDKVDLTIEMKRNNATILYSHHREIAKEIAEAISGKMGKAKKIEEKGYQWAKRIMSRHVLIGISSPKQHRTKDDELESNIQSLGRISLTSLDKLDYEPHRQALFAVHEILEKWRVSYHIAVVEIALDTQVEAEARLLARTAKIKWIGPELTFNFDTGKKRNCGSEHGSDEYNGKRNRRRRQLHRYYKKHWNFWRTELIFYRRYLKRRQIHEIPQLFEQMECLVQRNLSFVKLDMEKLCKDLPAARSLGLENLTPNGCLKVLTEFTGYRPAKFTKYWVKTERPQINYTATLPNIWKSDRLEMIKELKRRMRERSKG